MANLKTAKKRVRSSETRRLLNRYQHKTVRTSVRKLKQTTDKTEAEKMFPSVVSKIDKLVKKNIIHKNKAGHLKSELAKHINSL